MDNPIVYIIGVTINGEPIYSSDVTKNNIQRVLREIWNHRPDHDPPTWKDFFDYTRSHSIDTWPDLINAETIMEQVICLILDRNSMDEITPMQIEPNIEEIVEEFFNRLEPVTDEDLLDLPIETLDQLIDEIEEEEEEEESEIVTKRKEKVAEVQQILEGIMETDSQKLDQGSYLALCNLLRDVHQG